jgi:hypothetical protein
MRIKLSPVAIDPLCRARRSQRHRWDPREQRRNGARQFFNVIGSTI